MNTPQTKPDGKISVKDKNGKLRRESSYKNGLREGAVKYWYETGELEYNGLWEKDTLKNYTWYYKSGQKRAEGIVVKTITIYDRVIQKTWYEDGGIESEEKVFPDGIETKEWYKNGKIKLIGKSIFVFNCCLSMDGVWIYYNEQEDVVKKMYYQGRASQKGENDWQKTEYYENGKLLKTETK
jgi:antitoxin component YwqK of YwqJK toxin-antitoxin module